MRNSLLRYCLLFALALCTTLRAGAYNDHRWHNLDSLERAVARWTPQAVDIASEKELLQLNRDYRDLMLGYNQLNGEKSDYYARKALEISRPRGWHEADADAFRYIGMHFYGREQYDSAMVYYLAALEATDLMADGTASDDTYSALYGTIGNLYNVTGDIPKAMEYYEKAGRIFDKHGWNESNSTLYYNIGETWVDEGNYKEARKAYQKALDYARAAADSLMEANALKGLGRMHMEQGHTWKALRYLHEADGYYSAHEKEELGFAKENYEYMSAALLAQRRQLMLMAAAAVLVPLLLLGVLILAGRLRVTAKEKKEVSEVLEETIGDMQQHASAGGDSPALSGREEEILDLIAKGYTTAQIAEALYLSPETIKWYRKTLLVKFDVANTAELISRALSRPGRTNG